MASSHALAEFSPRATELHRSMVGTGPFDLLATSCVFVLIPALAVRKTTESLRAVTWQWQPSASGNWPLHNSKFLALGSGIFLRLLA
ncbi:hypothetical protein KHO49_26095 [Pseudomonas sp. RC4D1]|uniref:hypothetical protein n=1 Tax=Pseudomonas sp. RC4D1 TaxID=2834407 RepID=UPI001BCFF7E3|nr:hypothetical protein [Pseudomonas sp. RC4D1]MBS7561813.1 hypothetical protein [Pseudomonas sp. RC4D1]